MKSVLLAATAVALLAIRHWPRGDGIARATTVAHPAPTPAKTAVERPVGTSDLARGFWGHLFNGYDQRFVRRGLRSLRAGSDDPMTARVRA